MTAAGPRPAWWPAGRRAVSVLEEHELWGERVVDALDSSSRSMQRLRASELEPIVNRRWAESELVWRAGACRVLALAGDGRSLGAASAHVELLPHQERAVERALGRDPVRLAICDEVGLGKTITAAAIMKELKVRRRIRRVLVV